MKRTALFLVMIVSAAALFANGTGEAPADPPWNPIEITGTISVENDYPILTSGGTTYLLGAPRAAWYLDEIEEGQELTVRGHLVEEPRIDVEVAFDQHVLVDQVVLDGDVYPIAMGGPRGRADVPAGRGPMFGDDFGGVRGRMDDDLERGRFADGGRPGMPGPAGPGSWSGGRPMGRR